MRRIYNLHKVYKIHKEIPEFGLKKGSVAKMSAGTAERYSLKEYKPKTAKNDAPEVKEEEQEEIK